MSAFAEFEHSDIPNDSNAIAYDCKLVQIEKNEGYLWPDHIFTQAQINSVQENTIRDSWIASNLSFTLKAYAKDDNNFILPLLNRGLLNHSVGNYDSGFKYLLNAKTVMGSLEQKDFSLGKEQGKIYKGEPYEQALASFYMGLMLYQKEDYENARAMFAQTVELDRETVPTDLESEAESLARWESDKTPQDYIDIYNMLGNDNRIAYYMLARTYSKLEEEENVSVCLKNVNNWQSVPEKIVEKSCGHFAPMVKVVEKSKPLDNPFVLKESFENDNLVLLIEMGGAPKKQISGMEGQKDVIGPRHYPEKKARVYVDDELLCEAHPMFNLLHQSVSMVRTSKDTSQTAKAVGKFALVLLTSIVSDDLGKAVNNA